MDRLYRYSIMKEMADKKHVLLDKTRVGIKNDNYEKDKEMDVYEKIRFLFN